MNRRASRRNFLKTSAAAGMGFWVAGGIQPRPSRAANDVIGFACIGVGGKGKSDSADAARSGNMVAICDVDDDTLDKAAKGFPKAKRYNDFRKMLEEMEKSIDAVTVSTPDHTHAVASVMAMKMGKHCFTQKPMTHSIYEARVMSDLARETKLATQMGNQGTSQSSLREAAAVVRTGVLGKVSEVHVWTNRPIWPQGVERPTDNPDCPSTVHWPEWIGPAPMRPYSPAYHPFKWRGWWDFGTGALGDMACHTVNMPYMALELKDPVSVQAETSGHNKETYPAWSIICFEFPELNGRPPVKLYWYDGGKLPPEDLFEGSTTPPERRKTGALIIGDKGKLLSPGDYAEKPLEMLGGLERPAVEYEKSPGHFEEWVNAIKGGKPACSNFADYAGGLTEVILLGNLSVWGNGKKIEWDAKNLVATNAPEVMHVVKPEFHNGYSL